MSMTNSAVDAGSRTNGRGMASMMGISDLLKAGAPFNQRRIAR
jgi:hypothetical protein